MKKVEMEPVDVTNDAEMVAAGLRQPSVTPRDKSVWEKTDKERRLWKKQRRFPAPDSRWAAPDKTGGLPGKLVVQVDGLEKTTFSHKCTTTDVRYLLSKYKTENSSIIKCSWNGKEFNPEDIRLWGA